MSQIWHKFHLQTHLTHCRAANYSQEKFLGNLLFLTVENEGPSRHLQKQVEKTLSQGENIN